MCFYNKGIIESRRIRQLLALRVIVYIRHPCVLIPQSGSRIDRLCCADIDRFIELPEAATEVTWFASMAPVLASLARGSSYPHYRWWAAINRAPNVFFGMAITVLSVTVPFLNNKKNGLLGARHVTTASKLVPFAGAVAGFFESSFQKGALARDIPSSGMPRRGN